MGSLENWIIFMDVIFVSFLIANFEHISQFTITLFFRRVFWL